MRMYLPIISTYMLEPDSHQEWEKQIPASMKRRDPRIWQMAWFAAQEAIEKAGCQPRSVIVATALGALDETCRYLDNVFATGFGSPKNFIASVHNSMAGKLAMAFSVQGPNLTMCEGQNSFASALIAASLLTPHDFPTLLLSVDENIGILQDVHPHLSDDCRPWLSEGWQDCAIAFVLGAADDQVAKPALSAAGICPVDRTTPPQEACISLVQNRGWQTDRLLPLSETSVSFISPAKCAYSKFMEKISGTTLIGSYSPSSSGAAVTALCQ